MDSRVWIVVVAALALLGAAKGGFFALLLLDVACAAIFRNEWYLGPLSLDGGDIVFGTMALLLLAGSRPDGGVRLRDVPGIRLWVVLGLFSCWAYLSTPLNADRLVDPVRVSYQLYRYCWKPILLYPLVYILVGSDSRRARTLLMTMLVLGGYTAGTTMLNYLAGGQTTDLISGKNKFAGSLVAPLIACFALLLATPAGRRRVFLLGGMAVLAAGLVAAGSRGAIVAAGAAAGGLALLLVRFAGGRRRLIRLAGWGVAGVVLILLLAPDVSNLPGVRLLSELQKGAQVDNLVWRLQERWPYFWRKIMDNPWLGVGTDRDLSLALTANTPHNGYLSMALISGLPVAVITTSFGIRAIWVARRTFMRRGDTRVRLLALGVSAAIAGLLVHNLVESTITMPYVAKLYWLLVALGVGSPLLRTAHSPDVAETTTVRLSRPRRRSGRISIRPLQPVRDTPLSR